MQGDKYLIRPKVVITEEILDELTFNGIEVLQSKHVTKAFKIMKSEEIEMIAVDRIKDEVLMISDKYNVLQFEYDVDNLKEFYTIEKL